MRTHYKHMHHQHCHHHHHHSHNNAPVDVHTQSDTNLAQCVCVIILLAYYTVVHTKTVRFARLLGVRAQTRHALRDEMLCAHWQRAPLSDVRTERKHNFAPFARSSSVCLTAYTTHA